MAAKNFMKDLGKKINGLRRSKSLSQAELAEIIGISRSAMVQIELGNRSIDIFELKKLSQFFDLSIDQILSDDFDVLIKVEEELPAYQTKNEVRVSIPEFKKSKFRNVFIYILENCAGKPGIDELALTLILYFCDFNYYELFEEHLTGSEYRKSASGPVSTKFNAVINEMITTEQIKRIKTVFNGKLQLKLFPLTKADLRQFSAAEKSVIDQVLIQMSSWSTNMLSEYVRMDMPCMATIEGEPISYNLVFYRELPYTVRVYED